MSGEDATARPHAPRLIVVEDDLALQDALVGYLRLCGFDVVTESTAVAFYDRVVREMFDVAVIDMGLPDLDGTRLADYLHTRTTIPVVMITADTSREARQRCLDAGADLWLAKPFDPEELVVALRRLASRSHPPEQNETAWQVDSRTRRLTAPDGSVITVTAAECVLLERFAAAGGGIVSRETLIGTHDGHADPTAHNALEAHIRRLRRKLAPLAAGRDLILTAYGTGYSFAAPLVRR